ncbi:alpha/beta fold hydrolase [Pedobacter sp. HMF7647]|uniref:Proline iminopeptidase n=1 Tax=Hufsiella arboris TaxID=2695275 RepID=A0A7K1YD19_9SPHI|nr:alpha/beta hydrolase [Hufsiella arboris]MXV51948.1 alpha/beta fold hydrolase [Hufsiella arboris]
MNQDTTAKTCLAFFYLSFVVLFFTATSFFGKSRNTAADQILKDSTTNKHVREERFIEINGIDEWVTIKGNSAKPVILFIHGGPGSTMSPYSDAVYGGWEKDFVIVQWDQRGAGRTFGRNAPEELSPAYLQAHPLTVDQITADGIQLAEYLTKYLHKNKVILFGTSWGSIIGAKMALKRPDLFYAYIGHSQVVNAAEDLISAYKKVYQMAQKAGDQKSLSVLDSIGKPPYDIARNAGRLLRIIKKYERENSAPAPASWFILSPEYDNLQDNQHREDGDDYSFVNYVGDKRLGVKPMNTTVNFLKDSFIFKIPVYLIQGEEDILTAKEITKVYFDKIKAPAKEFILLPNTAHGFNSSVVDTQLKIMRSLKNVH